MPDDRRFRPYCWVTYVTGLLSGEKVCEWSSWYRTQFNFAKRPRSGDLAEWSANHDAMVRARVMKLEGEGARVTTEDQNSFKLEGTRGTLAGKPDIVAFVPDRPGFQRGRVLVVDEKSGEKKMSDAWQVILYQFALERTIPATVIDGEVEYRDGVIPVPWAKLTIEARTKIKNVLQMATGELEPPKTPSAKECKECPIVNCDQRIESVEAVADASDVF